MKTVFISDLHLSEAHPELTRIFIHFLASLDPEQYRALYILGDFFDVWVGDDAANPFHQEIAAALAQAKIPVYFMSGNRDFALGHRYAKAAKLIRLKEPAILELGGKSLLLMHGDLLCTDDRAYLRYRAFIQNPLVLAILACLPVSWRQNLAKRLRRQSTTRQQDLKMRFDVNLETVETLRHQYHCDYLIHGHTHRPGISDHRITLDAWHERGNACVIDDDFNRELIYFA